MKKFLLLFASLSAFSVAQAQVPVDPDSKLIIYQETVQQEGTRDTLYIRAIAWINAFFNNPQSVTSVRDRENGVISGHHRVAMKDTDEEGNVLVTTTIVEFDFKIETKDGRYRYTFNDFSMKATSKYPLERWLDKTDPTYQPKYDGYLSQVDTHIKAVIADLKKGMQPKKVKSDEW